LTFMEKYLQGQECLVMSREQVRAFDEWAINILGIPGAVLMENAGRSCAELIIEKLAKVRNPKVTIFCGTGNNGGDGYVIARHLLNHGFEVKVIICGDETKIKGDAKINLDILQQMGMAVEKINPAEFSDDTLTEFCSNADMLVDALFGTGLNGELKEDYQRIIRTINSQALPILAVDIPSGLDCNTGCVLGEAIKAACTVTFVAVKKGFLASKETPTYTGDIYVASIGINPNNYPPKAPG